METLLQQVRVKDFKPSNFSVYSIIEEDGFITELEGMFNEKYSVDDFEYMVLDLSIKEKNGILYYMSYMTNRIQDLKNKIEKARVYINREKCFISIVKLKEFNLKDRIGEIKIGDEQ